MTTKKKPLSSSPSTSAVAKLLLRWRGRSKAAKDESIEFFSELRSSQPDRRGAASDHAGEKLRLSAPQSLLVLAENEEISAMQGEEELRMGGERQRAPPPLPPVETPAAAASSCRREPRSMTTIGTDESVVH
mgnify:CR=1 FL=1